MMRGFLAVLAAMLALHGAARAECQGQNLIGRMSPQAQQALRAQAAQAPFAVGNYWLATRGDEVIHLIGTYHFDDARHDATLASIAPDLAAARLLLVEAGPQEEAALKARVAADPQLIVNADGPTLPEVLAPADWQALSRAMQDRGIPAFMAAKFRPWYVTVMLGIPACAMDTVAQARGLDGMLADAATAQDVPIRALEPYDTLFGIFDGMSPKDQLDMILAALWTEDKSADLAVTMADSYFAEEGRLIWDFSRLLALDQPGYTPDRVDAEFAQMEAALISSRNRAWIPVIEAAAKTGPVFAGFGALHLSGKAGVLNLLAQDGYTITRLPLH